MNIYVIGAGAAGMICAITAAELGANVYLIEKNEKTGKKIYITGKGRCNLTNCTDFNGYMDNIINNKKFLISSLQEFDSNKCMLFFENLGLKLKVERGNRVFPYSDKSSDVIKVLNNELSRKNVKVLLNETVKELLIENSTVKEIVTDKKTYIPDKTIICTGGLSYPLTGSTGDGYKFAEKSGHKIVSPKPALTGIIISSCINVNGEKISKNELPKLQGISLKNVGVKIMNENYKTVFYEFGEMVFTEKGVSGPIILTLSSKINRLDFDNLFLSVDLKPALTEEKLNERILRDFSENRNKLIKNSLSALLLSGLIPLVLRMSGIRPDKVVNEISREERNKLVKTIKNLIFKISGLEDISSAIVTSGGIDVKNVNPKTMESKLIKNLYFAGEVLDIDALTGGFNLQIAFATGYAAGKYAALYN